MKTRLSRFSMGWTLLAFIVLAGCATGPVSDAPPAPLPAAQPAAAASGAAPGRDVSTARRVHDRFVAQTYLWRLAQSQRLREDQGVAALVLERNLASRAAIGAGRAVDVIEAKAATDGVRIALHAGAATIEEAQQRHQARYGAVSLQSAAFPRWAARWPATREAALADAAAGDQADVDAAWRRVQRAKAVLAVQGRRVDALDATAQAFRQQFDIGQRNRAEMWAAVRERAEARVQRLGAELEVWNAEADVMAWLGQLGEADLPLAARADPPPPVADPAGEIIPIDRMPAPAPAPPPVFGGGAAPAPAPAPSFPPPPRARPSPSPTPRVPPIARPPDTAPVAAGEQVFDAPGAGAPGSAALPPTPSMPAGAEGGRCGNDLQGRPVAVTEGLPNFDWPPGEASSEKLIPREMLLGVVKPATLGAVADRLEAALSRNDYPASFLAVPRGFALVTRVEQIRRDGAPLPSASRWSRELPRSGDLGLSGFVQALFRAPAGNYRVIVFVVTAEPWSRGARAPLGEARLRELECAGLNGLPPALRNIAVAGDTRATALVYEFEKSSDDSAATLLPSGRRLPLLDATSHLQKSGIWKALQAPVN